MKILIVPTVLALTTLTHAESITRTLQVDPVERISEIDISPDYSMDPTLYLSLVPDPQIPGGGNLEITMPNISPSWCPPVKPPQPNPPVGEPPSPPIGPTPPVQPVTPVSDTTEPTTFFMIAGGLFVLGMVMKRRAV